MVTVRFRLDPEAVIVEAKGHALFDARGKDVVCAAVSTLLQSWLIGVKELCQASVEAEQGQDGSGGGNFTARMTGYGVKEKLLLDNLILSLKVLQNQYGEHIKVTVEETNGRR